jgi:uncharacterized protein YoxC
MDFILGFGACALCVFVYRHFFGSKGALGPVATTLQTLLEGVIQIMTQAAQDILGKLDAVEQGMQAKVEAAVSAALAAKQAELDAEAQAHADDLNAIGAKVDQMAGG